MKTTIFLIIISSLVIPSRVLGFAAKPSCADAIENSNVIIEGKVLSTRKNAISKSYEMVAQVEVLQSFKGPFKKGDTLFLEFGTGVTCPSNWYIDKQEYIIFAKEFTNRRYCTYGFYTNHQISGDWVLDWYGGEELGPYRLTSLEKTIEDIKAKLVNKKVDRKVVEKNQAKIKTVRTQVEKLKEIAQEWAVAFVTKNNNKLIRLSTFPLHSAEFRGRIPEQICKSPKEFITVLEKIINI